MRRERKNAGKMSFAAQAKPALPRMHRDGALSLLRQVAVCYD
jgi:hypothetical protein